MAKDLKTFLRMLTFDTEISDGSLFKFKEDYEESEYKQEYIEWLKREFNLDPVEELSDNMKYGESPENIKITKEAEDMYKTSFLTWHMQFCDIEEQYYCAE